MLMRQLECNKGNATVEFTIAFLFLSICLWAAIHLSFAVISREARYYSSYMKARAVKVLRGVEEPQRKECEDNSLWYVQGEDKC